MILVWVVILVFAISPISGIILVGSLLGLWLIAWIIYWLLPLVTAIGQLLLGLVYVALRRLKRQ